MARHRFVNILGPLFHALLAGVAEHGGLINVQQGMRLSYIGDIAGRADDRIHYARSGIDADAGLRAEMPVIVFLRLVHLWITLAVLVFGQRQRGVQRGVVDGGSAHH